MLKLLQSIMHVPRVFCLLELPFVAYIAFASFLSAVEKTRSGRRVIGVTSPERNNSPTDLSPGRQGGTAIGRRDSVHGPHATDWDYRSSSKALIAVYKTRLPKPRKQVARSTTAGQVLCCSKHEARTLPGNSKVALHLPEIRHRCSACGRCASYGDRLTA
jgi:hypothetical protein